MLGKMILSGWKMPIKEVRASLQLRYLGQTAIATCVKYRYLLNALFFLFFFFLLVFPKGGVRIKGIPLTWGYLFLAVFSCFSFIKSRFSFSKLQLIALLCILPFAALGIGAISIFGMTDVGFAASFIISFLFLPVIFFLFFSKYLRDVDRFFFDKMLANSLFAVALFGVIAFIYTAVSFDFILIPHLMIPPEDIPNFAETRMIDRGNIFKLVSTYNNGNIYGVCMLMFANYYFHIEKSRFRKVVFVLSLLLTLSRTVWIGLFVAYLLGFFFSVKTPKSLLRHFLFWVLMAVALGASICLFNINTRFIFDADLGGRLWQFEALKTFSLLPSSEFEQIWEIVYLSVLQHFGVIGLLLFLFGMLAPIAIHYLGRKKREGAESWAAQDKIAEGLIVYLIVCCSDGVIQYIPTMAFFWFLSSLLLTNLSSHSLKDY